MSEANSDLKNIFIGSTVSSQLVMSRLEEVGIKAIVRDRFSSGTMAGFGGGLPENLELYVREDQFITATEIINELVKEGKLE